MYLFFQVKISEKVLQDLLYFTDCKKFPTKTIEDVASNKLSLALLIKRTSENLSGDIDEVILQLVYGNSRKPPGDEKSPSQKLLVKIVENEEEKGEKDEQEHEKEDDETKEKEEDVDDEKEEENLLIGIWAPPNNLAKATVLKYLFPNLSGPFVGPEIQVPPLYVAVCYDAFKAKDVMELSQQYPGQIINYGFFTSDIPAEARLLAKTVEIFDERKAQLTYDEKLVIQLSKSNQECLAAFSELGPTYMSQDALIGEMDCKLFFPPGYNESEAEANKQEKKKQKKKGRKHGAAVNKEASVTASEMTVSQTNETEVDHGEDENEEQDSDEEKPGGSEEVENSAVTGADKATSPMHEKVTEE